MGYRENALEAIRALIFQGDLPIGVKTSEREISERLGGNMSRTPVREALAVLTQTGIVVQYPQIGLMIPAVELEEALEAQRLREALETVTVQNLAVNHTGEGLELLRLGIKDLENASNFAEKVAAESNFHCGIAIQAGYRSAVQPLTTFMDKIALFQLVNGVSDAPPLIEEHRSIVAAIGSADESKAVDSMRAYLHVTHEVLTAMARERELADERVVVAAVATSDDRKQAAVLRALLSKGARLTKETIWHPNGPPVAGYRLQLNRLADGIVLDGMHAREIAEQAGVDDMTYLS